MRSTTLSARVARVQTLFTVSILALVAVGTSIAVHSLLARKADQHLLSVTTRIAAYVPTTLEGLDLNWFRGEVDEIRPSDVRIELLDASRRVIFAAGPGLHVPTLGAGCTERDAVRGCATSAGVALLIAARESSDDLASRRQLDLALFIACGLAGLAAAVGSRSVTRRAVQPLADLAARVESMEPGSGRRLGRETGLQELDGLAAGFDALVERFEQALNREKRFAAQASHELRTPLTVARAEIELLSRGEQDLSAAVRAMGAIDRLTALVQALLWFARAQERLHNEHLDVINLADLVRSEVTTLQVAHSSARFLCELPDEALVRADEDLVRRAVSNLLENAIQHGAGETIEVTMTHTGGRLAFSVRNGGSTIPLELREQIFLPFFRARPTSAAPGFGLGLPLARAVARAHGGDVEVGSERNDETEMVLRMPLVMWHQAEAPLT
ncbi:MAG: HAMP domain-containing sensor histidine kinase [Deltaproteobacteria bacterium]